MPNEKKVKIVSEIKELLSKAPAVVFADYQSLKTTELESLRRALEKAGGLLKVVKNTLLKLALETAVPRYHRTIVPKFSGPTAVLFCLRDPVAPIKALVQFAKEHELPKVKFGLVEGEIYDSSQVLEIAKIPSREVLLAHLAWGLSNPMVRFATVLGGQQRGLVRVLHRKAVI